MADAVNPRFRLWGHDWGQRIIGEQVSMSDIFGDPLYTDPVYLHPIGVNLAPNSSNVYFPWWLWCYFSVDGVKYGKQDSAIHWTLDASPLKAAPRFVSATEMAVVVKPEDKRPYYVLFDDNPLSAASKKGNNGEEHLTFWYYEKTLRKMAAAEEILLRMDVFQSLSWRTQIWNAPVQNNFSDDDKTTILPNYFAPLIKRCTFMSRGNTPDPLLDFSTLPPIAVYFNQTKIPNVYQSPYFYSVWGESNQYQGKPTSFNADKQTNLERPQIFDKGAQDASVVDLRIKRYYVFQFDQIDNAVMYKYDASGGPAAIKETYWLFRKPQNPKYYFFPVIDDRPDGGGLLDNPTLYTYSDSDDNKNQKIKILISENDYGSIAPNARNIKMTSGTIIEQLAASRSQLNVLRSMYPNNFKGEFLIPFNTFNDAHIIDFLYFWLPLHVGDEGGVAQVSVNEYWNGDNSLVNVDYANMAFSIAATEGGTPIKPYRFFAYSLDMGVIPITRTDFEITDFSDSRDKLIGRVCDDVDNYIMGQCPLLNGTNGVFGYSFTDKKWYLTPPSYMWFNDNGLTLSWLRETPISEIYVNFGGSLPNAVTSYDEFVAGNRQTMDSGRHWAQQDAIANGFFGSFSAFMNGFMGAAEAMGEDNLPAAGAAATNAEINIAKSIYSSVRAYQNADRQEGLALGQSFATSSAKNISAPDSELIKQQNYIYRNYDMGTQGNNYAPADILMARIPTGGYYDNARYIVKKYGFYCNLHSALAYNVFTDTPPATISLKGEMAPSLYTYMDAVFPDVFYSTIFVGESVELREAFKTFLHNGLRMWRPTA